jgi:hypothetical protein
MKTLSTKRGRPKLPRLPMNDTGTPELVMKRLRSETTEMLDMMLERSIIDVEQHWCGTHLRWLYTLRFGAPGVRAIDPLYMGGVDLEADDPHWRELREAEYAAALSMLGHRLANIVLAVAVHNEKPARNVVACLQEGLYRLTVHWCRQPRRV